jgi:CheY-like chemotaxis protein
MWLEASASGVANHHPRSVMNRRQIHGGYHRSDMRAFPFGIISPRGLRRACVRLQALRETRELAARRSTLPIGAVRAHDRWGGDSMKILVVDNDLTTIGVLEHALADHAVRVAHGASAALAQVVDALWQHDPFDAVICELLLGGPGVMSALRAHGQPPICILMAGYEHVVEAAMGAEWVLMKPLSHQDIADVLERVQLQRARTKTRELLGLKPTG